MAAFVVLYDEVAASEEITSEISNEVRKQIGPIASPDRILVVAGLPKTRSGKIMRRILRKLAANEGEALGDISTLLNPEVVAQIKEVLAKE